MLLKGENIFLRAIESTDVGILYKWENDIENWTVSNTTTPFTRQQIEDFVNGSHDIYTTKQLRFIICLHDQKPIGSIDLFDFDSINQRSGVGILIAEKQERQKGYAKAALELLIDYCFSVLFLHQLYCNIGEDNEASIKLFTDKNFQIIGLKKDWQRTPEGFSNEYILQLINYNDL